MLNGSTDPTFLQARRYLLKQGLRLQYGGQGLGGLILNVASPPNDVVWGPKPKPLVMKTYGSGQSGEMEWSVSEGIPECDPARFTGVAEFTYDLTFDTDKWGFSSRTFTYKLRIASSRGLDGRSVQDSPDYYIANYLPALLPGFRRSYGPRKINEAKDTVTGAVVDAPFGGVYPPIGIADWDFSESIHSIKPGGTMWAGMLTAWYEAAADCPDLAIAAYHFFVILARWRLSAVNVNILENRAAWPAGPGSAAPRGNCAWPIKWGGQRAGRWEALPPHGVHPGLPGNLRSRLDLEGGKYLAGNPQRCGVERLGDLGVRERHQPVRERAIYLQPGR